MRRYPVGFAETFNKPAVISKTARFANLAEWKCGVKHIACPSQAKVKQILDGCGVKFTAKQLCKYLRGDACVT